MGNALSFSIKKNELEQKDTSNNNKEFVNTIDFIASHYILSMNSKSLRKMYEKEYCNKITILTSDIIQKHFTHFDIINMSKRIKNGEKGEKGEKGKKRENNVVILDNSDVSELDMSSPEKKQQICNQIAKFYIKVAHIFSAIVMTINPEYIYKDAFGNYIKKNLYEKDKMNPADTTNKIVKLNLCSNRVNALKEQLKKGNSDGDGDGDSNGERNMATLVDEPGIPELMDLYYDEFNYKTGNFDRMSEKTKVKYHADLKKFYLQFTGKSDMPDSIKRFSDIKLHGIDVDFTARYKDKNKEREKNKEKNNEKKDEKNAEETLDIINVKFYFHILI